MRTSLIHASDLHLTWEETCHGELPWSSGDVHTRIVAEALVERLTHRLRRGDRKWHLVITGDLIDTASKQELELAREILGPIWDPDLLTVVPGNHDSGSTLIAAQARRMGLSSSSSYVARQRAFIGAFGELMTSTSPFQDLGWPFVKVFRDRGFILVGLDSTADNTVHPEGEVGEQQLEALDEVLARCEEDRRLAHLGVWVALHHPPATVSLNGLPFGLADADRFMGLVEGRVTAIIHGHAHRTEVKWDGTDDEVPVLQAGPPGYDEEDDPPAAGEVLSFPCYTLRDGDLEDAEDIGELEFPVSPALRRRQETFRSEYAPDLRKPVRCKACEGPVTAEMAFCPWCAEETDFTHHAALVCEECCRPVMPGFEYCPWCGEEFGEAEGRYDTGDRMSITCTTGECSSKVEAYHRYCPDCGGEQEAPDDEHPETCNACAWPVDSSTYLFCPWCGDRQ